VDRRDTEVQKNVFVAFDARRQVTGYATFPNWLANHGTAFLRINIGFLPSPHNSELVKEGVDEVEL
jgi:hypothetical protein